MSLIAKLTATSQKIEDFSTIGFVVAREISRFLYTDKINVQKFAAPVIFGIQLNEKVYYVDADAPLTHS